MEFLTNPEIIGIIATLLAMLIVFAIEKLTKRDVFDSDGEKKVQGLVKRALTWAVGKLKKKKPSQNDIKTEKSEK